MGQLTRFAVELLLTELDARDLLTVFLEDPEQIELVIRRKGDAAESGDHAAAGRARRGRQLGGASSAG